MKPSTIHYTNISLIKKTNKTKQPQKQQATTNKTKQNTKETGISFKAVALLKAPDQNQGSTCCYVVYIHL